MRYFLATLVALIALIFIKSAEAVGLVRKPAQIVMRVAKTRPAWKTARPAGYTGILQKRRTWHALDSRAFPYAVIPEIYNFFKVGMYPEGRMSQIPRLFSVMASSQASERFVGIGSMGIEAWDMYEQTRQVAEADFDQGYLKEYTHKTFAQTLRFERSLVDDDQYGIMVADRATHMGDSAWNKRESDAASIFNNAFTAGVYAGPDGKALCATNHPRSPNKSGSLSNKGTSALTADAVEATRIEMMTTQDDAGNVMSLNPDTLIVPPALMPTAGEIVGSPLDPASANNTANTSFGAYNVIVWNKLTDSNNWFMADSNRMRRNFKWFNRVPADGSVEITFQEGLSDATSYAYQAYMRYSYGFVDWRGIYGHEVT